MTQHNRILLSDTTATRLTPNGTHSGMDITVQNPNLTGYIYIGSEGVNASSYGFLIFPKNSFSIELSGKDSLYAIADTDDLPVVILRTNLESGN
jgi:hypothetical protein